MSVVMGKRTKRGFLIPAAFAAFVVMAAWMYLQSLIAPVTVPGDVLVNVPPKSTTAKISTILWEKQLIRNALLFKLYAKINGFEGDLKAGLYRFSGTVSWQQIREKMTKGQVETISFTIPEGYTVGQIADLLAEKGLIDRDRFFQVMENGDFSYPYLPSRGKTNRLEGFLFPDTYRIAEGCSEEKIVHMMLDRFDQVFQKEWRLQAEKMRMSVLEAVTLASIIEREAKVASDRPLVSSVFHNRLERNMNLESCATVQYALGEVKEVLLLEDLKIESPYNTYIHGGLPPGPIASPGKDALQAALYPADTKYLYFVAKKDGSHYFSKTLAEHNGAKRKYLKYKSE